MSHPRQVREVIERRRRAEDGRATLAPERHRRRTVGLIPDRAAEDERPPVRQRDHAVAEHVPCDRERRHGLRGRIPFGFPAACLSPRSIYEPATAGAAPVTGASGMKDVSVKLMQRITRSLRLGHRNVVEWRVNRLRYSSS
jgi:hypothetical protein